MPVTKGGKFSFSIKTDSLAKGLRPSKRMPRNTQYLVECCGAVGRDGVLQAIDQLTRMATSTITDAFPYPQIFVFTNTIIVCGSTKIYEWVGGALVPKLTASVVGSTWSAVDFYDYVYMSNGRVAVVRSAADKTYSEVTTLPTAMSICNFQGQVMVGAPDVSGLGANLVMDASSIDITVTQHGDWA